MARLTYEESKKIKNAATEVLNDGEYKLGDGKYLAYYYDENGKRRKKTAVTLERLREKMAEVQNLQAKNVRISASDKTLDDCYHEWRHLKDGIVGHTMNNYKWVYEHYMLGSKLGKTKLNDITKGKLRAHYQNLREQRGLAVSTVDGLQTVVRQVVGYAVDERYIPSNFADGAMTEMKRQNNNGQAHPALTKAEQDRFISYIESSPVYKHWGPVFKVLIGTGMRVSECCGLRRCDVDFENGIISVNHGLLYYKDEATGAMTDKVGKPKTKASDRKIVMIKPVEEAFREELENREKAGIKSKAVVKGEREASESYYSDFIFVTKDGGVQHQAMLNRAIKRIVRDANLEAEEKEGTVFLPDFSCHCLRSTYITRAAENNVPIEVTMKQVGHTDKGVTTQIYLTVHPDWMQRELAAMEGMFA